MSSPTRNDERHLEILRSLPREDASPAFTAGVLARVRQDEGRRAFCGLTLERAVLAAALVFMALAVGLLLHQRLDDAERRETLARIEALEAERAALEAELLSLQRDTREAQGLIYLSSTPDVDMVLDMGRLARRRSAGDIRPAVAVPNPRPAGEIPGGNLYFR
jgi:hypothetical protein